MQQFIRCFLIVFLVLILDGCAGRHLNLSFYSSPSLNTDVHQNSLPVLVRVYQLAEDSLFKEAGFYGLWKQDDKILSQTLLAKDEFSVEPNSQESIHFTKHPRARFIAIMALFREPTSAKWRVIKEVSSSWVSQYLPTFLTLSLQNNQLELVS